MEITIAVIAYLGALFFGWRWLYLRKCKKCNPCPNGHRLEKEACLTNVIILMLWGVAYTVITWL